MDSFVYPSYGGESLLNVPSTVLSLFGVRPPEPTLPKCYYESAIGAEKIILFLVDGLGLDLFEKGVSPAEDPYYSLFARVRQHGLSHPLTSIFPSSTAPAINTLNSGVSPLEHGLPEWHVYFPEFDCVVRSLPFTPLYDKDKVRLQDPPPQIMFDRRTIYQSLAESGVRSFAFIPRAYSDSFYNQAAGVGSEIVGYRGLADCLVSLRRKIEETPGPAYIYVYYPEVDGAEHSFGPGSDQVRIEVGLLSYLLQREFVDRLDSRMAERVALFLTADHGQILVSDHRPIYLDEIPGLPEAFARSPSGQPILPSGAPRDVYLHIQEDRLEEVRGLLEAKLAGIAQILTVEEGLQQGLFGEGECHPQLRARLGNLMILPYEHRTVWYHFEAGKDISLVGQHGGLSREEMLVPFIATRLADLKG